MPLQMLNHRAGFTAHPSIDFYSYVSPESKNHLLMVHPLAFHRFSSSEERPGPLRPVVPHSSCQIHHDHPGRHGSLGCMMDSWISWWRRNNCLSSVSQGLALDSTGAKDPVLHTSARFLMEPFQKPAGTLSTALMSVFLCHFLQRFSLRFSTIIAPNFLSVKPACFYFFLLPSPCLHFVVWERLSPRGKNISSLNGG